MRLGRPENPYMVAGHGPPGEDVEHDADLVGTHLAANCIVLVNELEGRTFEPLAFDIEVHRIVIGQAFARGHPDEHQGATGRRDDANLTAPPLPVANDDLVPLVDEELGCDSLRLMLEILVNMLAHRLIHLQRHAQQAEKIWRQFRTEPAIALSEAPLSTATSNRTARRHATSSQHHLRTIG